MDMNRVLKAVVALLLIVAAILVAGCNKPDDPNNGGNNGGNDTIAHHEFVDLALPSGILWATCNVGADTPEDYGDYFSWGETSAKEIYDWKSYRYGLFFNERYELNKYCTDSLLGLDGFVDNLTVLEPADDAATANWGTDWRIPTIVEWDEMFQNTTSVWTTQNGVNGWRFTASNGNSIFLPAAGYWWESEFNGADLGVYWSVTLNTEFPYRAWGFHFNPYQCHLCGSSERCRGQSVRAVRAVR